MKKYDGKIFFRGKYIPVNVVEGKRYIAGRTVDEFFNSLTIEEQIVFAKAGQVALDYERKGKKTEPGRLQYEALK